MKKRKELGCALHDCPVVSELLQIPALVLPLCVREHLCSVQLAMPAKLIMLAASIIVVQWSHSCGVCRPRVLAVGLHAPIRGQRVPGAPLWGC